MGRGVLSFFSRIGQLEPMMRLDAVGRLAQDSKGMGRGLPQLMTYRTKEIEYENLADGRWQVVLQHGAVKGTCTLRRQATQKTDKEGTKEKVKAQARRRWGESEKSSATRTRLTPDIHTVGEP